MLNADQFFCARSCYADLRSERRISLSLFGISLINPWIFFFSTARNTPCTYALYASQNPLWIQQGLAF